MFQQKQIYLFIYSVRSQISVIRGYSYGIILRNEIFIKYKLKWFNLSCYQLDMVVPGAGSLYMKTTNDKTDNFNIIYIRLANRSLHRLLSRVRLKLTRILHTRYFKNNGLVEYIHLLLYLRIITKNGITIVLHNIIVI